MIVSIHRPANPSPRNRWTGNAIVLSALLQNTVVDLPRWWSGVLTVATLIAAGLVLLSLVRAAEVLVTVRDSRSLVTSGDTVPLGLIFNGTNTVREIATFGRFQEVLREQTPEQVLEAAQVELWIVIRQHRLRYTRPTPSIRCVIAVRSPRSSRWPCSS